MHQIQTELARLAARLKKTGSRCRHGRTKAIVTESAMFAESLTGDFSDLVERVGKQRSSLPKRTDGDGECIDYALLDAATHVCWAGKVVADMVANERLHKHNPAEFNLEGFETDFAKFAMLATESLDEVDRSLSGSQVELET